jgi:hypothetical protein
MVTALADGAWAAPLPVAAQRPWVPVADVVLGLGRWREREIALAEEICRYPETSPTIYRLISVHRLRKRGVPFDQIAEELGISARHARRLYHRRVYMALRRLLTRMEKAASASEDASDR